ncbi:MAG: DUF3050 domain-containing protein [Planctomycetota bacterium]|jgi:hypothetical protein
MDIRARHMDHAKLTGTRVQDATSALLDHEVYTTVRDLQSLRTFMEHHAVCVLDFMTLLKRLQADLTCVQGPWVPPADPVAARLINEIVLDEESDASFGDEPCSHYEWYLAAMEEVGADTGPLRTLESRLREGIAPQEALEDCGLPPAAEEFARTSFELASGPLHVTAGAFVHGRENVIPTMFVQLVQGLRDEGVPCEIFASYLERHISVDSNEHGPAARTMLKRILDDDPQRHSEALQAAESTLRARIDLWDATVAACASATEVHRAV